MNGGVAIMEVYEFDQRKRQLLEIASLCINEDRVDIAEKVNGKKRILE